MRHALDIENRPITRAAHPPRNATLTACTKTSVGDGTSSRLIRRRNSSQACSLSVSSYHCVSLEADGDKIRLANCHFPNIPRMVARALVVKFGSELLEASRISSSQITSLRVTIVPKI